MAVGAAVSPQCLLCFRFAPSREELVAHVVAEHGFLPIGWCVECGVPVASGAGKMRSRPPYMGSSRPELLCPDCWAKERV